MGNNPYLTLIRCITALYLINKVPGNWAGVKEVVAETLKHLELPKSMLGEGDNGTVAMNLQQTADWMIKAGDEVEFNKGDLLARVRISLRDISSYASELETALPDDIQEGICRQRITSIASELKYELNLTNIRKLVRKANHSINFGDGRVDYDNTVKDLQERLSKLTAPTEGEKTGFVGRLGTDNASIMTEILEKAKEVNSTVGVLRTGLVGLNRSCGIGGFRRGELINFGALTHHYKTGMLNDVIRTVPLYNKPFMWDEKKKPAVLRISFENKLEQDLPIIYRSLIEQETGEAIDVAEIDPVRAGEYIKERMEANGYTFFMECYDPNNFTVYDLIDILMGYEAKGYELHMVVADYLELIARGATERLDEKINDTFQVVRNHCFPRGITFATGHQLSTEAQAIWREGPVNFTQRIVSGGYYRNTKSLHTKLDLEFLMAIITGGDGEKYLSVSRGKHRGGERTPHAHLNFAYQFKPVGGICDDVLKEKPEVIYNLSQVLNGISDDDIDLSDDSDW